MADLRMLYERQVDGPLVKGDHVGGAPVAGFATTTGPVPDDRLLLAGDEVSPQIPTRPIPAREHPGIRRCGPQVAHRLAARDVTDADDITPGLRAAVSRAIGLRPGPGRFVGSLVEEFTRRDCAIWLIGGAVRDLVADPAAPVNDLDFAGTMLPGELHSLAPDMLAINGLGDHRPHLSPGRVLSVMGGMPDTERIIEYKALSQHGFHFPASGGDLLDDVGTRDLTINGLYYDLRRHVLIDPSGRGVRHLRAKPRTLAPVYTGGDPLECAKVVIRTVKFAVRSPDADMSEAAAWVDRHLVDLACDLPADMRRSLLGFWGKCIPEEQAPAAMRAVQRLGTVAGTLIHAVRWGGRHAG
ncbi:hypothetical protein [Nonomuraea soli]|uniref:Poly A polymerase head domain-containing protein n=1 Tax=Nonomuraea soli TaxID=1032476 RepID=A0A7W0HPC2_9ACTN|nr:hypothetical protein [Nonomuraea soli]MBA2890709.1 hypothetical protein [Nonomuraea soli]